MRTVKNRYETSVEIMHTLGEVLALLEDHTLQKQRSIFCDSALKRFAYSVDTFLQFIKAYIIEDLHLSIDINTPKAIVEKAHDANIITKEEFVTLVKTITRRNETSRAYNKNLAHAILEEVPLFYKTMHVILTRLNVPNLIN